MPLRNQGHASLPVPAPGHRPGHRHALIPGSHKAYAQHSLLICARVLHLKMGFAIRNFFVPEDIALHSADQDCVVAVEAKAGDMVIFLCAISLPL